MGQFDGVLQNIHLIFQIGIDIDGGIRHQQSARISGNIKDKDMADPTIGPQSGFPLRHFVHQFIRMQRAFHQGLGFTRFAKCHGAGGRFMRMLGIDDLQSIQIEIKFGGNRTNFTFRPHQNGNHNAFLKGIQSTTQRDLVARMSHRNLNGRTGNAGTPQQFLEDMAANAHGDFLQLMAFGGLLHQGRFNLSPAFQNHNSFVIDGLTFKYDAGWCRLTFDHHFHRNGLTHINRGQVIHFLMFQHGTRPGQFIADNS